jgi:hypothetical protein
MQTSLAQTSHHTEQQACGSPTSCQKHQRCSHTGELTAAAAAAIAAAAANGQSVCAQNVEGCSHANTAAQEHQHQRQKQDQLGAAAQRSSGICNLQMACASCC